VETQGISFNKVYRSFDERERECVSDLETDLKFLVVLEEADVDIIKIYVNELDSYSAEDLERYDTVVRQIKMNDKKLAIDFYGWGGTRVNDFDEYKEFVVDSVSQWTERYGPDYMAPVVESGKPDRIGLSSESISIDQWHSLIEESCNAVKAANPFTKCVVIGHKEDLDILKSSVDVDSVDVVGFNIYGTAGVYDEYEGYLGEGDVVGRAVDYVTLNSEKETMITETWLTLQKHPTYRQPWREPLDAMWLEAMTYYSQKHDMKGVVPFFSFEFIDYFPLDASPEDLKSALDEGKRTQVFQTYKDVIEESKSGI
jgi:hypothetical protein